jgi:riboflavin biosynthesis pyrimidine reductase
VATRTWFAAQSTLTVVSGRLGLAPEMRAVARAPTRAVIFTHAHSSTELRQRLSRAADGMVCGRAAVHPRTMLAILAQRGLLQVLCEGRPNLVATLIEAHCIDELCPTLSPVVENGDAGAHHGQRSANATPIATSACHYGRRHADAALRARTVIPVHRRMP